uniref:BRICHOS domain-containing protein n=1 Tax=Cyanistes caeruleus TaxID=156563 RepID=A0A8C0ZDB9_CYACU
MNLSILTAVLLGLVLHPALALYSQKTSQNGQIIFGQDSQITITGISQGVRINSQTRVVIIEQKTRNLSWKTIWNYNRGIIATKVTQQNACYISAMNRNEIPSFDNLARLAAERRNQIGLGRASRRITFVTNGLVNNLSSYGMDIMAMCSGVTTYRAQQVHVFQGLQVNLGSCITLDVLRVVELKYCNGNGNWNQNWTGQWDHNWNGNWTGQWDHNWNHNWTGNFPVRKPLPFPLFNQVQGAPELLPKAKLGVLLPWLLHCSHCGRDDGNLWGHHCLPSRAKPFLSFAFLDSADSRRHLQPHASHHWWP